MKLEIKRDEDSPTHLNGADLQPAISGLDFRDDRQRFEITGEAEAPTCS